VKVNVVALSEPSLSSRPVSVTVTSAIKERFSPYWLASNAAFMAHGDESKIAGARAPTLFSAAMKAAQDRSGPHKIELWRPQQK
jgi:hypothetical protein